MFSGELEYSRGLNNFVFKVFSQAFRSKGLCARIDLSSPNIFQIRHLTTLKSIQSTSFNIVISP
jgi:hypothetical protein